MTEEERKQYELRYGYVPTSVRTTPAATNVVEEAEKARMREIA